MPEIPPPSMRLRVGEARRIRSTDEEDVTGPGRSPSIISKGVTSYS